MITCRELSRLLTEYFDGAMSPAKRLGMRIHLMLCKDCRIHLVKMRQLVDSLSQIQDDTPHPQDLVKRLIQVSEEHH